jgi:hypothetical protein
VVVAVKADTERYCASPSGDCPPLPLSLNPPFTPSITPLCRKSGGAQGGICQQNTEERNKEKEFKREKEKENLNTFFSNIQQ